MSSSSSIPNVVPAFSEGSVEGFMPRNRRFGFVTAGQLNARTVAHELGHGAFNLRHTFPKVSQGSTDNLMDYPPLGGQVLETGFTFSFLLSPFSFLQGC